MSEITMAGSGAMIRTGQPVKNDLLAQFVAYIDRSPKTTRTYLTNLRQFVAWLRYADIEQPARADVITFREWLAAEHEAIEWTAAAPGWRYRLAAVARRLTPEQLEQLANIAAAMRQ